MGRRVIQTPRPGHRVQVVMVHPGREPARQPQHVHRRVREGVGPRLPRRRDQEGIVEFKVIRREDGVHQKSGQAGEDIRQRRLARHVGVGYPVDGSRFRGDGNPRVDEGEEVVRDGAPAKTERRDLDDAGAAADVQAGGFEVEDGERRVGEGGGENGFQFTC